jgi:hypothetical protein
MVGSKPKHNAPVIDQVSSLSAISLHPLLIFDQLLEAGATIFGKATLSVGDQINIAEQGTDDKSGICLV